MEDIPKEIEENSKIPENMTEQELINEQIENCILRIKDEIKELKTLRVDAFILHLQEKFNIQVDLLGYLQNINGDMAIEGWKIIRDTCFDEVKTVFDKLKKENSILENKESEINKYFDENQDQIYKQLLHLKYIF